MGATAPASEIFLGLPGPVLAAVITAAGIFLFLLSAGRRLLLLSRGRPDPR
ncbi:MAG: hypothetical protein IH614_20080, partial [Desulfuromonadales bacterium]|nr:hypothetical protein [Desulfuromonadales bacterium]